MPSGLSLCTEHWAMLNAELHRRKLDVFVPQTFERYCEQLAKRDELGLRPETFNPAAEAFFALVANGVDLVGPEIIDVPHGEERCLLCWLSVQHKTFCTDANCVENFDWWIGEAVRDQHEYVMSQLS